MAFSLLLLKRIHFRIHKPKFFSSIETSPNPISNPDPQPKPTSLSARMNFIFDQIDAIEEQRSQKDDTLQRIRAWRLSKKPIAAATTEPNQEMGLTGLAEVKEEEEVGNAEVVPDIKAKGAGAVQMVHPWPEWIELIERLVRQNYFDHRRRDEDKLVEDLGFEMPEEAQDDVHDFTKDWKTVQAACLNFGKDRFDILRSLSRQDIQVLVGYGCPSTDRKVVFSSKLLRKLVHLDEGDVCSSCNLRSSCERGYLVTNKEDEARTIDIMRLLLTFGFDPLNGPVVNDALLKKKSVKTVVRKLLHEVVKLSAVPIDPNLPPPVIKRPPPKVKQTPPPPKKRVGRDDIEMKKGDWLCPKCDFMNFAKNTVCLQCDAKRPKRQLLPGEWECPGCNFLNYRRNMACFHCDCKRPPDEFTEVQMEERQRGPRMRSQKVPTRTDVSDAWNLDFDDNESDGADVAAFEYADSRRLDEDFPYGKQGNGENMRQPEAGFYNNSRPQRPQEREYSARGPKKAGVGFDDFDDDEEDDIESYELDSHSGYQSQKSSSIPFSDLDVNSDDSDDAEAASDNWSARQKVSSQRNSKISKPFHRETVFSGSVGDELDSDSDDQLSTRKSSQSRARQRGINHGSDEDPGLSSDIEDDFPSRRNKGNRPGPTKRGGKSYEMGSDFESDNERGRFRSDRFRGTKGGGQDRRRNPSKGRGGGFSFTEEDSRPRSRGMTGDRRNSFDRSPGGSRGDRNGFRGGDHDGNRRNGREDESRSFRSPRQDNFGNKPRGRFSNSGGNSGADSYLTEERYSRPRVNVR